MGFQVTQLSRTEPQPSQAYGHGYFYLCRACMCCVCVCRYVHAGVQCHDVYIKVRELPWASVLTLYLD